MSSAINLHAIAQFSAERMLNCVVEGVAIALFAWLLLRVVGLRNSGRQNSGTRFAVWFVALFAIAALPLVGALAGGAGPAGTGNAHSAITVPGSWAIYGFVVWASIASLGLFRVGVGLWHVRQVRKNCSEINVASLDPALQVTIREFRSVRSVRICVSDKLQVPTAIGFVDPAVALPAWTLRELSPGELNAILLHELAHLRRWDDWTNLAQKLLGAVFFFHPAVWWIESKLSLEREMACDDAVLAETADPRAYAECLVTVTEKSLMRRGLVMAQAAVTRVRQTSQRVAQILDKNRTGATRIWKPALGMVAAFAMVCVGWLSQSPELVAFRDKATSADTASAARPMVAAGPVLKLTTASNSPKPVALSRSIHPVQEAIRNHSVIAKARVPQPQLEAGASVPVEAKVKLPSTQAGLVPVSFILPDEVGTNEASPISALTNRQPRLKSVVLVYQGLEYDDAGFAHWTICVWRVSVPTEPTISTNPPKST